MAFTSFMSSSAGRAVRIIAGLALIVVGLAVVGGTGGIVLAVVGLVPLGAGIAGICLFGPLLGSGLHGNPRSTWDHERSTR
jgi:hypothetical protein